MTFCTTIQSKKIIIFYFYRALQKNRKTKLKTLLFPKKIISYIRTLTVNYNKSELNTSTISNILRSMRHTKNIHHMWVNNNEFKLVCSCFFLRESFSCFGTELKSEQKYLILMEFLSLKNSIFYDFFLLF